LIHVNPLAPVPKLPLTLLLLFFFSFCGQWESFAEGVIKEARAREVTAQIRRQACFGGNGILASVAQVPITPHFADVEETRRDRGRIGNLHARLSQSKTLSHLWFKPSEPL
jgi:hypothetical protein